MPIHARGGILNECFELPNDGPTSTDCGAESWQPSTILTDMEFAMAYFPFWVIILLCWMDDMVVQVAAVAVLCVQPEPSYRPLITDVLHSLIPLVPIELGGTLRVTEPMPHACSKSSAHWLYHSLQCNSFIRSALQSSKEFVIYRGSPLSKIQVCRSTCLSTCCTFGCFQRLPDCMLWYLFLWWFR